MLARRLFLSLGAAAATVAAAAAAVSKAAQAAYRRFGETPTVWIPLDGRTLSRREYPELYDALVGTLPAGTADLFRIPDLPRYAEGPMIYLIKARRGSRDIHGFPVGTAILTIRPYDSIHWAE